MTVTRSGAVRTSLLPGRLLTGLRRDFRQAPVFVVLGIIWAFFYSQNPAFLSGQNISNLALQIVTTAILALGIVFVLLVGEIDLSSAILSGVAATIAANLAINHGWVLPLALAFAGCVAVAAMLGQSLIVVFGVPSLIVTLGGMVVFQGLLLVVLPPEFTVSIGGSDFAKIASASIPISVSFALGAIASTIYGIGRWRAEGKTRPGQVIVTVGLLAVAIAVGLAVLAQEDGLPLPVLVLAVLLTAASFLTTRTRYGVRLYAVGGNREAAQRAGIPVARMVVYSFLILGACAFLAGVIDAARTLGVSNSSGGGPLMLNAIAAAVVGGTSLFGGRGSVWSALLGALVIGSITNGVQLLGFSPEIQNFATGGVLIIAVAIDVVITRGSLRPRRT